ncbi:hypothetical protein HNY73_021191 [Argiope bruennichi]|uniref:Uncharacterized protein n=1 Tax=Argiope bruennichi TaxID=94029 RepID=A0A8T0EA51_ARGBR|nr:hypothetical protein HNY73_021191 [Argiope bruennichi]
MGSDFLSEESCSSGFWPSLLEAEEMRAIDSENSQVFVQAVVNQKPLNGRDKREATAAIVVILDCDYDFALFLPLSSSGGNRCCSGVLNLILGKKETGYGVCVVTRFGSMVKKKSLTWDLDQRLASDEGSKPYSWFHFGTSDFCDKGVLTHNEGSGN